MRCLGNIADMWNQREFEVTLQVILNLLLSLIGVKQDLWVPCSIVGNFFIFLAMSIENLLSPDMLIWIIHDLEILLNWETPLIIASLSSTLLHLSNYQSVSVGFHERSSSSISAQKNWHFEFPLPASELPWLNERLFFSRCPKFEKSSISSKPSNNRLS